MTQHEETRICILEVELKIDARQNVKRKECLVLKMLKMS